MPCHRRGPAVNVVASNPRSSRERTTSSRSWEEEDEFPFPLLLVFDLAWFGSRVGLVRFRDDDDDDDVSVEGVGMCT